MNEGERGTEEGWREEDRGERGRTKGREGREGVFNFLCCRCGSQLTLSFFSLFLVPASPRRRVGNRAGLFYSIRVRRVRLRLGGAGGAKLRPRTSERGRDERATVPFDTAADGDELVMKMGCRLPSG